MIIKKYPAPPIETAASRYDRDWLNIPDLDTAGEEDLRHARTLLEQPVERKSRRYVDDGISAATGGPYTYDPNIESPVDELPGRMLFSEDFLSDLDPAWEMEGTYNPPGGKPNGGEGETLIGLMRPLPTKNCRVDFELDFPQRPENPGEGDHFLPQVVIQSESAGSILLAALSYDLSSGKREMMLYAGGEGEVIEITESKFSLSHKNGVSRLVCGDLVTESTTPIDFGEDVTLSVTLQTSIGGAIKSITVYDLSEDNGGGTPEPEGPSEPEVPEGSYQEIYTETY